MIFKKLGTNSSIDMSLNVYIVDELTIYEKKLKKINQNC